MATTAEDFSLSDDELLQRPITTEKAKKKRSPPAKKLASEFKPNVKNVNLAILKKIVETPDKKDWDNNVKEFLKSYRFNINPATISTELAVNLARNELDKPKRANTAKADAEAN